MASLVENVREILSIKLKTRYDSYTDQYSRIFMVKILFISTLLIGFDWYSDKIRCIVPDDAKLSGDFVSEACWVQGFYVYESVKMAKNTVAYFGIPTNLDQDGRYKSNGKLCIADPPRTNDKDPDCIPMKKTFFLHYQYMPFFVASLGILFYLPYLIFKIVNADMMELKMNVKSDVDGDSVIAMYFCRTSKHVNKMRIRVFLNFIVKLLYIFSNLSAFFLMDEVFNGEFLQYGITWSNWNSLANEIAYDYMGKRGAPKPGNVIMPTFGICEIHEGARDARATITNKHKFICEYSQNILYHYVLALLWFVFVVGIIISTLGFLWHSLDFVYVKTRFCEQIGYDRDFTKWLTFREYEYLRLIRRKNLPMYHEIMEKLQEKKRSPIAENKLSFRKMGKAPNGFV